MREKYDHSGGSLLDLLFCSGSNKINQHMTLHSSWTLTRQVLYFLFNFEKIVIAVTSVESGIRASFKVNKAWRFLLEHFIHEVNQQCLTSFVPWIVLFRPDKGYSYPSTTVKSTRQLPYESIEFIWNHNARSHLIDMPFSCEELQHGEYIQRHTTLP